MRQSRVAEALPVLLKALAFHLAQFDPTRNLAIASALGKLIAFYAPDLGRRRHAQRRRVSRRTRAGNGDCRLARVAASRQRSAQLLGFVLDAPGYQAEQRACCSAVSCGERPVVQHQIPDRCCRWRCARWPAPARSSGLRPRTRRSSADVAAADPIRVPALSASPAPAPAPAPLPASSPVPAPRSRVGWRRCGVDVVAGRAGAKLVGPALPPNLPGVE